MTESQPNSKSVDKSEKKRNRWWRWPLVGLVGGAAGATVVADQLTEGEVSQAALAYMRNRPVQVAEQYPSSTEEQCVEVKPTTTETSSPTSFDESIEYDKDISPREAEILGNKAYQYLLTWDQEREYLDTEYKLRGWGQDSSRHFISLSPLDNRWKLRKMPSPDTRNRGDVYWLSPVWFSDEQNSLDFSSEVLPTTLGTESTDTHDEIILVVNNSKLIIEPKLEGLKFGFYQEANTIDGVRQIGNPFVVVLDPNSNNIYHISVEELQKEVTRKNKDGTIDRFPVDRIRFFSISPANNGELILSYSAYSDSEFDDNGQNVGYTASVYPKRTLAGDNTSLNQKQNSSAILRTRERLFRNATMTSGRATASKRT